MNCEETLALWRRGKGSWEAWARAVLAKKKAMQTASQWSVDWYGEGQNEATTAWLQEATADFTATPFEEEADFAGMLFPGPADFDEARFARAANFANAQFADNVSFERAQFARSAAFSGTRFLGFTSFDAAQFAGEANFDRARFLKQSRELLASTVRFRRARFGAKCGFQSAHFACTVEFVKTIFAAEARFDEATFAGDALFKGAQYDGIASFIKARFSGTAADFGKSRFAGDTRFHQTHFGGSWGDLVISGGCRVSFEGAHFGGETAFQQTWFVGESEFKNARFEKLAAFDAASFVMPAGFADVAFAAKASFKNAHFAHEVNFEGTQFLQESEFNEAKFAGGAVFARARFAGAANFGNAEFTGNADFRSIASEAAFALDGTRCTAAPDFIEAKFAVPPALGRLVMIKPKRRLALWRRKAKPGVRPGEPKVRRPVSLNWPKIAVGPRITASYRHLRGLSAAEEPSSEADGVAIPAAETAQPQAGTAAATPVVHDRTAEVHNLAQALAGGTALPQIPAAEASTDAKARTPEPAAGISCRRRRSLSASLVQVAIGAMLFFVFLLALGMFRH